VTAVRLLASASPGEMRIAVVEGDRLLDYALWRPGAPDGVGDLHRGRIEAILPALGGVFVALASGSGFLPMREPPPGTGVGDPLLVRIVRSAQGGKGPRLALASDADEAHGRQGPPARLEAGPDPLTRLAAAHPGAPILSDDRALPASLPGLRDRLHHDAAPFPAALEARIAALAEPEVGLPGGMRASIHPTPALVAIDVDAGSASAARLNKATAQFAANRAAIGPLLHEIRLRNLSGAILIDLAGLPSRKRAALRPEMEEALSRDPLHPRLLGFTALGLAEILRPRIHPPLHELLSGPHAAALAALRAAQRAAAVPPYRLPVLHAGIGVAAALENDAEARRTLAEQAGHPISIRMNPSLPPDGWELGHE